MLNCAHTLAALLSVTGVKYTWDNRLGWESGVGGWEGGGVNNDDGQAPREE